MDSDIMAELLKTWCGEQTLQSRNILTRTLFRLPEFVYMPILKAAFSNPGSILRVVLINVISKERSERDRGRQRNLKKMSLLRDQTPRKDKMGGSLYRALQSVRTPSILRLESGLRVNGFNNREARFSNPAKISSEH